VPVVAVVEQDAAPALEVAVAGERVPVPYFRIQPYQPTFVEPIAVVFGEQPAADRVPVVGTKVRFAAAVFVGVVVAVVVDIAAVAVGIAAEELI